MKQFSIAILLSLLSFTAKADLGSYEVSCHPQFRPQGTVLNVEIEYGTRVAKLTSGAPSFGQPVRTAQYQTAMSESDDLTFLTYIGDGFELIVNQTSRTASLKANFFGKPISAENLACDIQRFRPHPGVSGSN